MLVHMFHHLSRIQFPECICLERDINFQDDKMSKISRKEIYLGVDLPDHANNSQNQILPI